MFLVYSLLGGDPSVFQTDSQQEQEVVSRNDPGKKIINVILADTEYVWSKIFHENNLRYRAPKLVLYSDGVQSVCGRAGRAVGPFYCPMDERVYLDLSFFSELSLRLGEEGDLAEAYVIAHVIGHHIQKVIGITESYQEHTTRMEESGKNRLSVLLELQADCLAGVWVNQTDRLNKSLIAEDKEEAMRAASAVGEDRLKKQTRSEIIPDSFTHETFAHRLASFESGMEKGDPQVCLNRFTFH